MSLTAKTMTVAAAKAKALGAMWAFPSVIFSAFLISWGAEAAQFLMSQGLALAILAWLQTLPEFMVEATIAWNKNVHLMTANLTGSLRLLVGLGWPLIFFTAAFSKKSKTLKERFAPIKLRADQSVEIVSMLPPIAYFGFIYLKGSLTALDAIILILIYVGYLSVLRKIPSESGEGMNDLPAVPRYVLNLKPRMRNAAIGSLFVVGGLLLFFSAEPFLESMMGLAVVAGISEFVFVQWCAPFLSEFPEKLSAFKWARTVKGAPMALMNMISSTINQWTLLAAMLPIVYSVSMGHFSTIPFDPHQRLEILLTIAQSAVAFVLVCRLELSWRGALGLFVLWLVQFIAPGTRESMVYVYASWIILELVGLLLTKRRITVFDSFKSTFKEHCM